MIDDLTGYFEDWDRWPGLAEGGYAVRFRTMFYNRSFRSRPVRVESGGLDPHQGRVGDISGLQWGRKNGQIPVISPRA